MDTKTGPISPKDVAAAAKATSIPDEVFEAFNEAIAAAWNGSSATLKQESVIGRILDRMQGDRALNRALLFERHWLDIEPAYRAKGWKVEYDKPGYNESYEATFVFTTRRDK